MTRYGHDRSRSAELAEEGHELGYRENSILRRFFSSGTRQFDVCYVDSERQYCLLIHYNSSYVIQQFQVLGILSLPADGIMHTFLIQVIWEISPRNRNLSLLQ